MPARPANLSIYALRARDGLTADRVAQMSAGREVRRFVPEWAGFASSPTDSLKYVDGETFGLIWTRTPMIGESNAPTFTIANVPVEIRPTACRMSTYYVIDDGELELGGWQLDASGM